MARSRRYPSESMPDADYAGDVVLRTKTPSQAVSLLHGIDQASGGIVLLVNTNKAAFMYFKREVTISSQNGRPLKLIDKFGSNISFTGNDVNICLV